MSPSPGLAPADPPCVQGRAPDSPGVSGPGTPNWPLMLSALLVSLALSGLGVAAVSVAEHWSLPLEAALGLGLGCTMLIAALAYCLLRTPPRAQPAPQQSPSARATLPAMLDNAESPSVLLTKVGNSWHISQLNNAAREAGAPAVGASAAQWLSPPAAAQSSAQEAESESFAYTVSHDLRAPIRVIEGFTRIVREDYGQALDRIGNDHLDRVLGAAARMNNMIDALLALAQLASQPLVRQRIDLSRMAQYVLDDLHKHAPQRQVETRVMPGLTVDGDPTLLRLVLENLLGNAWKYSSRREVAHIEFGAEERAEDGRIFYVSDDGAGFDMRFAERLFGAFQRLHSASEFQGTGVGLASVRRIVRRHGGDIWAEAEVDRGATFYFTLV